MLPKCLRLKVIMLISASVCSNVSRIYVKQIWYIRWLLISFQIDTANNFFVLHQNTWKLDLQSTVIGAFWAICPEASAQWIKTNKEVPRLCIALIQHSEPGLRCWGRGRSCQSPNSNHQKKSIEHRLMQALLSKSPSNWLFTITHHQI